ncbi:hypothetical protein [Sporosarcina cyprini]|nr:hypothetical protein [Sporosarcina cyprini]MCG3086964.1 hypothetical protein [Sporosarcina cyprini]
MKIGKLIKTAIKWAPVVYPVVRKIMKEKKQVERQRKGYAPR